MEAYLFASNTDPDFGADGLPDQCGRLFAIRLPAGSYEIYKARFDREFVECEKPAVFSVTGGEVRYLGNIHVDYCLGMVNRFRGNILGGDISVNDQYARDTALIRERLPAPKEAVIKWRPLPGPAWRYRLSFTPYDWGYCKPEPPSPS